jgi:hypothetical protein
MKKMRFCVEQIVVGSERRGGRSGDEHFLTKLSRP